MARRSFPLHQSPKASLNNTHPSWAQRQADYTGIDPLVCSHCDHPLTFVGTFFGNWNQLQYLFDQAGKDSSIPLFHEGSKQTAAKRLMSTIGCRNSETFNYKKRIKGH